MQQGLEIHAHRLGIARLRTRRGSELDDASRFFGRPTSGPNQIGYGRARPSQRVEPRPFDAANDGDHPAAILDDLHADLRCTKDPPFLESPCNLPLEL